MRILGKIPTLSLLLPNKRGKMQEVYPLIVNVVMQRSCKNYTAQDAGTSGVEDFLSSATVRVLTAHKRYNAQTELSTFLFKHIRGSYMDLMRREMTYQSRHESYDDNPNGYALRQSNNPIEEFEDTQEQQARLKAVRRVIPQLTELQRYILYAHYFDEQTFKQIGKDIWLDTEACEEEHNKALAFIRERVVRRY